MKAERGNGVKKRGEVVREKGNGVSRRGMRVRRVRGKGKRNTR